ncbi:MAG: DUF4402 domain-containing protein [Sphingomicrobium sp.]
MKNIRYTLAVAAAAALALPGTASAGIYTKPTKPSTGKVIILDPLSFIKVDDLDFGAYVIPPAGSGTVTINPIDSGLTLSGTITPLPQFTPQRGRMIGSGSAGQDVQLNAVIPDKLYIDGDTSNPSIDVTVDLDHVPDSGGIYYYTINSSKVFNVYLGGQLTIATGQEPGIYSNTYTITATYQ